MVRQVRIGVPLVGGLAEQLGAEGGVGAQQPGDAGEPRGLGDLLHAARSSSSRVVSTASYAAVPSAGRNPVAAVRGVGEADRVPGERRPADQRSDQGEAPPAAATRADRTRRAPRTGRPPCSSAGPPAARSSPAPGTATTAGPRRATQAHPAKARGTTPLNPPRRADNTRAPAPCQANVLSRSQKRVRQHRDGPAGRRDLVQVEVDDQQARLRPELGQHLARAVRSPRCGPPRPARRAAARARPWPGRPGRPRARRWCCPGPGRGSAAATGRPCRGRHAHDAATQITAAPCSASRV